MVQEVDEAWQGSISASQLVSLSALQLVGISAFI
jgi:hypothetical protein